MIPFIAKGVYDFLPKWLFIAIAAALGAWLVANAFQIGGLKHKLVSATAERNAAIANYLQCQANEVTLNTAIDRQNAAVAALKVDDARRAREAEKALSEARRATATANRRIGSIMAARPSGAACVADDADRLILETVK